MSDTSFYDSRLFEERMQTEALRYQAAQEELAYWKRKRELLELQAFAGRPEPVRLSGAEDRP